MDSPEDRASILTTWEVIKQWAWCSICPHNRSERTHHLKEDHRGLGDVRSASRSIALITGEWESRDSLQTSIKAWWLLSLLVTIECTTLYSRTTRSLTTSKLTSSTRMRWTDPRRRGTGWGMCGHKVCKWMRAWNRGTTLNRRWAVKSRGHVVISCLSHQPNIQGMSSLWIKGETQVLRRVVIIKIRWDLVSLILLMREEIPSIDSIALRLWLV